ncbi:MAG: hypothetical protein HZA78_00555 [Candidatus Schekmanbacteria bacterium]|nr:hypothetical protein [Candidatus Schekmanbacteria bacterium]
MSSFRTIFFEKYASCGRQQAVQEFQNQYEPKKGERFNLNSITYEISAIEVKDKGLQFEISSKIPVELLGEKLSREDYYEGVKKSAIGEKMPIYVGMEDITRKVGDRDIKKRDYIRIRYLYEDRELFDDKQILNEVQEILAGKSEKAIPRIPGVQSPVGCLTLIHLSENLYREIKKTTQALISANEEMRKKL